MRSDVRKDALVTGEAVLVALPVAGPAIRFISGAVDAVFTVLLTIALQALLAGFLHALSDGMGVELDDALLAAAAVAMQVVIFVGVPVGCEALGGRTLGKVVTGLRTVRDDGAPADLRRLVTRHLVAVVEVWTTMGSLYLISLLLTRPTRRLGDMAAGTYVARDRIRPTLPQPPVMPAALEGWARGADLAAVPDDLVALVRSSLAQERQFTPEARDRVATDLAARMTRHVQPAPPPGTPPSEFLDAVLAERRRRDGDRLARQQQRRERLFPRP